MFGHFCNKNKTKPTSPLQKKPKQTNNQTIKTNTKQEIVKNYKHTDPVPDSMNDFSVLVRSISKTSKENKNSVKRHEKMGTKSKVFYKKA